MNTLVKNLREGSVKLPVGENGKEETVTMEELGISYPILVNPLAVKDVIVTDPSIEIDQNRTGVGAPAGVIGARSTSGDALEANKIKLHQFDFDVQFCWKQKKPTERRAEKTSKEKPKEPTASQ
jgi:hypothetical protein